MSRSIWFFFLCLLISQQSQGQLKLLKRAWIKHAFEEFQMNFNSDSLYLRYTFNSNNLLIAFEPESESTVLPYSLIKNKLTISYDEWLVETLTDSTLTIFLPGFRRIYFYSEEYLRSKQKDLVQVGEYNGQPVFKPTPIVTPRYRKDHRLGNDIHKQDRSEDYQLRKAGVFIMTFIVTAEGEIKEPKIIQGVAPGYDEGVIRELLKTSKKWEPARLNGVPVHTLVRHEVKFLDSIRQH